MQKEATKLVQWLRKSDSKWIHFLLCLPSLIQQLIWCAHKHENPDSKRYVLNHFGDASVHRTYYVIRINQPICGLASFEAIIACYCAYAEKRGFLPIVDLQNLPTMYHEAEEVGKINIWERYYEQPEGLSLVDTSTAKKVIFGDYSNPRTHLVRFWYMDNPLNRNKYTCYHQKYIRINEKMRQIVDQTAEELGFNEGQRILGVVARGTDYRALKPVLHAVVPSDDKMILRTREVMLAQKCTRLFLATEDLDILEAFQRAFPEKLVFTNQKRFRTQEKQMIAHYASDRPNDRYLRGEEYLTALELLARCDCLIGVGCNAFYGAAARKECWEYIEQFDEGSY